MNKRQFLLTAGLSAATAGVLYKKMLSGLAGEHFGERVKDSVYGDTASGADGGKLYASTCNGCVSHCGVRVLVENDRVKRVFGNPYSLLSSDPWLPMSTPLARAKELEDSHAIHSSVCARGNLVFDKLHAKSRVTQILKRVGKRGENRWKSIEPEQFIKEITEGGDLFGEGFVKGFKQVRDHSAPIDAAAPEFGPRANGLCIIATGDEGRKAFFQERFQKAFGTINFFGHTATCGLSMRSAMAAFLNDFAKYPHLKPDFDHCKFLICFGSAPAQAGNPFKRQGLKIADYKSRQISFVNISPVLTNVTSSTGGRWVSIRPGGDLALAMALIAALIDRDLINKNYLSRPSQKAAAAAGFASFSNASWLIAKHDCAYAKAGEFLRIDGEPLVLQDGELIAASKAQSAQIDFNGALKINQEEIYALTSFSSLGGAAHEHEISWLLKTAGVSEEDFEFILEQIAQNLGAVSVDVHGGSMQTTGFYAGFAILQLGALLGCVNHKGGLALCGAKYNAMQGEFNLAAYAGKVKPSGFRLDRSKKPYEITSEFKRKAAAGSAYPSQAPYYSLTNAICTDAITNAAAKYPYGIDILLSWNANVAYASNANLINQALADSSKIPLFIAIDPFINETSVMADYIVPDSVMYETWGVVAPWGGTLSKASHFRYPIVPSPNVRFASGEPVCMDSFVIELGLALGLPGFGKGAIKCANGAAADLFKPSDFYLRSFINVALDGGFSEQIDEAELAGLPFAAELEQISPEHYQKALFCMARGGKFAPASTAYTGNAINFAHKQPVALYSEPLAKFIDSLTGKRFSGTPRYFAPRYRDGRPLEEAPFLACSYKSNVFSSLVGASSALIHLRYSNYIEMNEARAALIGLKQGDLVRVRSASGSTEGILRTRKGLHPDAVAIEHGRARRAEGGADVIIDGKLIARSPAIASGVGIQSLLLRDDSRGQGAIAGDFVIGSVARTAIPVSVEKIASLLD